MNPKIDYLEMPHRPNGLFGANRIYWLYFEDCVYAIAFTADGNYYPPMSHFCPTIPGTENWKGIPEHDHSYHRT